LVATAPHTFTAEEFFEWANLPENSLHVWELERGKVVRMPSPSVVHGIIAALITRLLFDFAFQRGKGYVCSNDTGLLVARMPDTIRGPDVMFFDEHIDLENASRKYSQDVPALVVEVMSPSDRWSDMHRRISQYLGLGVPTVWVVSPDDYTVTICRPNRNQQILESHEEILGDPPLIDFRCKVSDIFRTTKDQST
jgi:Uma2 family endonuclease